MNFEADGINKNDWADIFKFGTVRLNLLVNFLAPETAPISPNPPLVSFKRDRNLRNSLVRSSLPSNLEVEPGTFNCSHKVCNTCPFINSFIVSLVLSATNSTLENQAVN